MPSLPRALFALFPAALVSAACGARTALPLDDVEEGPDAGPDSGRDAARDAPRDAAQDGPRDAGRDAPAASLCVPFDAGTGPDAGTCTRSVRVGSVTKSMPSCFVDLAFDVGEIGTLRYACAGGAAELVFSRGTFRGGFDGKRVDVCAGTSFEWSDGCTWESAQRADGDLFPGIFAFSYVEKATSGMRCFPPCSATGTIVVL